MDKRKQLLRYADNGKQIDLLNYELVIRDIADIDDDMDNDLQTFVIGLIDTESKPVCNESDIE